MIYRYEIVNNGKEDVLYLYLNMKYEYSKELTINSDDNDLSRRANNFIQSNNINFKGKHVYLIIDDIVVKSLDISKSKKYVSNSLKYSSNNYLINIKNGEAIYEITLRDYLLSIVFKYYEYKLHEEVLKAIIILYTTYAYKMMEENNYIEDNAFIKYVPVENYKSIYNDYENILSSINNYINEVDCYFLKYKNDYILPFIHYSNSGKTINNSHYPYLSSVKSLWDLSSPYYINFDDFSYSKIGKLLNTKINNKSVIETLVFNEEMSIKIDEKIYSLEEVRGLLNLKSTDIYIVLYTDYVRIITKGFGSGYGLSLFGANEIANNGGKYYNILKYYFPKTNLFKYIKELH